ncbi:nitroreductase/quinone reductase family protein [Streptomyces sparsogenes]|uniref:nitroreductase/quinone reductase family protein n=1 Tax=Streptomyces sparsogenes TaxID=67365 RepID=UPI0033242B3E
MDFDQRVIEEFRANNGQVGDPFEGASLILLTTVGARTGKPHTTPAGYLRDGDRYLVFGSPADHSQHPDWYQDVLADPHLTVELGTEGGAVKPFAARAVVLEGEERDRCWELRRSRDPGFRAYAEQAEQAERPVPVVALHLLDLAGNPERNRMIGQQLVLHHRDLRAELHRARAAIDRVLAGEPAPEPEADLAARMRRHCLTFCYALQAHHLQEEGTFTAFEKQFPHLAPAITRLRQEHAVVERALTEFEALVGGAAEGLPGDPADAEKLRAELDRLVTGLEEHFAYEERHLLPALGTPLPS